MVVKTERPLDEGLLEGDIKRRTRKCRNGARNFVTFEIHEDTWRGLPRTEPLTRQPLLTEATDGKKVKPRLAPKRN